MAQEAVFGQVNLVVSDMDATVAFYRQLGVAVGPKFGDVEGPRHVQAAGDFGVSLAWDNLAMIDSWHSSWPHPQTKPVFSFYLADREAVDDKYRQLTDAGYVGSQEPYDAFWGSRYAIVEDPDGNMVGLMSPSDDAHRQAPPTE